MPMYACPSGENGSPYSFEYTDSRLPLHDGRTLRAVVQRGLLGDVKMSVHCTDVSQKKHPYTVRTYVGRLLDDLFAWVVVDGRRLVGR